MTTSELTTQFCSAIENSEYNTTGRQLTKIMLQVEPVKVLEPPLLKATRVLHNKTLQVE